MKVSFLREKEINWLKSLILAFLLALIIRTFLFSPVTVDGASMEPTLHDRERIIVTRTITWIGEVNRGDIVIINDTVNDKNYVKRVIGMPGELIEMKDDKLFINGEFIDEPYLSENKKRAHDNGRKLTSDFGPLKVPDNHFFVMGDNRLRSVDSRSDLFGDSLGYISEDRIIGISKFVIYPLSNLRLTK